MYADVFDALPVPDAGSSDSTLFIDSPGKLPMSTLIMFLGLMGVSQAPFDISDGTGQGYILSSFFFILCVISTAFSVKLYFSTLEKTLSPSFASMVANHGQVGLTMSLVILSLILAISWTIFRAQIRFAAVLNSFSGVNLTGAFRFVALILCFGYSLPVVLLWKRNWIRWIVLAHGFVLIVYFSLLIVTAIHFSGAPTVNTSQRPFPGSWKSFSRTVCFNPILFIFPNIHPVANMLKNGRMSRCLLLVGSAIGAIAGIVVVLACLEYAVLAKVGSEPMDFCTADYLPIRLASLMSALSLMLSLPYYCVPLFELAGTLFKNASPTAKRFQTLIITVSTVAISTLLALWNLGAKILNVANSSYVMSIVMFVIPCLMHRETCGENRGTTLMKYWCYAFAGLQGLLGIVRFVFV